MFIVNTEAVPGYKITKTLGVVRGSSVRARWFGGDMMAGLKQMVGGELGTYKKLLDEARELALKRMSEDAEKLGANAIIGVRFTTSQVMAGAAEIFAYGTAVVLK